jgi:hypothetical protein
MRISLAIAAFVVATSASPLASPTVCESPLCSVPLAKAPATSSAELKIPALRSGLNLHIGDAELRSDDAGCCILSVPGQTKECTQRTKKECDEDAGSTGANEVWHAGACKKEAPDNCP